MPVSRNYGKQARKLPRAKSHQRTVMVHPDFDIVGMERDFGMLMPPPLKGAEFSVNGKRRILTVKVSPENTTFTNPVVYGTSVGYFMAYTKAPKVSSPVKFAPVDFKKWEKFFTELYQLESELCASEIDVETIDSISLQKLADHVPTYCLVDGKEHVRLRDCIEFLDYARFDVELMFAMKK